MATNKRKDAAALFELIDKSTLKVPKGAGNLKIPSWWSSKENPPARSTATPILPKPITQAPAARPPIAAAPATTNGTKHSIAPPPPPPPPITPQPRLFDPPPSNIAPTATPSIRPPAAAPAVRIPTSTVAPTPPKAAPREGAAVPAPSRPRIFAPLTALESRRGDAPEDVGGSEGPGGLAGIPRWALLGGAAGVLVILICIVLMLVNRPRSGGNPAGITSGGTAAPPSRSLLPAPPQRGIGAGVAAPTPPEIARGATPLGPATGGVGHVYSRGEVYRDGTQFYIVIASTPEEAIATRNADFIAQHGVDVSIEIVERSGRPWYTLVSVAGFASATAAEPYRNAIRDIGHLLPDFKRTGRAWDDARVDKVRTLTASGR